MASIRKHRDKWQVQIRRKGIRPISKSFAIRKDAVAWARQMEVQADRNDLPADPRVLDSLGSGPGGVPALKTFGFTTCVTKRLAGYLSGVRERQRGMSSSVIAP